MRLQGHACKLIGTQAIPGQIPFLMTSSFRRAAFDIGSGATKLMIAEMNGGTFQVVWMGTEGELITFYRI